MESRDPTPGEARAAVARASDLGDRVRRSDSRLRLVLLGMGALYVALGVGMGLSPRRATLFVDLVLLALLGLTVAVPILLWRMRAFSASGFPGFLFALGVFSIWNGATAGVSSATGWWGPDQPGSDSGEEGTGSSDSHARLCFLALLSSLWAKALAA